ncbi:MAG: hypothetical protein K0U39_05505 [Alphaproteobacteria bacterium]|nr:hypothetical protein [Alphaproteobacteria bacterium]
MRYHLVFTVFFIHLFFLFNIYIKDEIPAPENYVTCDFINVSPESVRCQQQYVVARKQFLHHITQANSLNEAEHEETIKLTKIDVTYNELTLEGMKLSLQLQKIDSKFTKETPPRIISALYRQRKHIINKFDEHFDRFDKFNEKTKAFYATISND